MFGRLVDVFIRNESGNQIQLVDHLQGDHTLRCDGSIERNPSTEVTSLILSIYNLDGDTRKEIKSGEYKYIIVKWGYKDVDGGELVSLFEGTVQRMITQRPDAATSVTKFFVWDTGDTKRFGFFSGTFEANTNLYDAAYFVAKNGEVETKLICSENLKKYRLGKAVSYFDNVENILQDLASAANMLFKVDSGIAYIEDKEENENSEVFVYTREDENGKVVSASGLIGIPTLSDDGMYFEALVNPRLRIFSLVQISNSIISNEQEGFVSGATTGAEFDTNGIYRVVKMSITFTNGAGESKMRVKTLARNSYSLLV